MDIQKLCTSIIFHYIYNNNDIYGRLWNVISNVMKIYVGWYFSIITFYKFQILFADLNNNIIIPILYYYITDLVMLYNFI